MVTRCFGFILYFNFIRYTCLAIASIIRVGVIRFGDVIFYDVVGAFGFSGCWVWCGDVLVTCCLYVFVLFDEEEVNCFGTF